MSWILAACWWMEVGHVGAGLCAGLLNWVSGACACGEWWYLLASGAVGMVSVSYGIAYLKGA